jgi:hypothetical protein
MASFLTRVVIVSNLMFEPAIITLKPVFRQAQLWNRVQVFTGFVGLLGYNRCLCAAREAAYFVVVGFFGPV